MELHKELDSIQLMVASARQHPVIKERLASLGYNDVKMQQALNLIVKVQGQEHNQWEEKNTYKLLRESLEEESEVIRQQFTNHRALAKVALHCNKTAYYQLELHQPQETKPLQWIKQVSRFYESALIHEKALAEFGLTKSELVQGAAMLKSVQEKMRQLYQYKGNDQHATHVRNQVMHSLRSWHRSFKVVAKVALVNEPQILESLGIQMVVK